MTGINLKGEIIQRGNEEWFGEIWGKDGGRGEFEVKICIPNFNTCLATIPSKFWWIY